MSIRSLLIHTVAVKKPVQSMVTGKYQPVVNYTLVTAALQCRCDPLPSKRKDSILGRFPRAEYVMMCEPTDLKDEYVVTYNGKDYTIRDFQNNYDRYYCCILEERK